MIYSDGDLRNALEAGALVIAPRPARSQFSTSAVDLRLDSRFNVFDAPPDGTEIVVHAATANAEAVAQRYGRAVNVPSGSHIDIPPKAFALAYTLGAGIRASQPGGAGGRQEFHCPSGPVDTPERPDHTRPAFAAISGWKSLMSAHSYVVCIPGCRICQLIIEELKNLPEDELQSRFQNQSPC